VNEVSNSIKKNCDKVGNGIVDVKQDEIPFIYEIKAVLNMFE